MHQEADDAAIQADAYIDALLAGHRHAPVAVATEAAGLGPLGHQGGVRDAIRLLEKGLPRFHPSFLFEEWLADQLKRASSPTAVHGLQSGTGQPIARIVPIAVIPPQTPQVRMPDRLLLVGGAAIASGVSIAGAAVFAWRRARA